MCVAILTLPGQRVDDSALFRGWTINRDGGGLAYVNVAGELKVSKGHLSYNKFHAAYEEALSQRAEDSPMLIHMRIGTSGPNNEANTHPFEFTPTNGPRGAMIHNGVLFSPSAERAGTGQDRKSDTRVVVDDLGTLFALQTLQEDRARRALGQAISSNNKFAFLYENKDYVIVNEEQGFWHDNVWYSNNTCGVRTNGRY